VAIVFILISSLVVHLHFIMWLSHIIRRHSGHRYGAPAASASRPESTCSARHWVSVLLGRAASDKERWRERERERGRESEGGRGEKRSADKM